MPWRTRWFAILTALGASSCGFVGIDLLDLSAALQDGGKGDADGGGPSAEAGSSERDAATGDASGSSDGSTLSDGAPSDGSAGRDASPSDGGSSDAAGAADADAQAPPACAPGFVNCDSTPLTCETPLGTVTNCASCGDVCPANGGTATCNAGTCGTVCNATGTYALKVTTAVTWPTGVVNGGSGTSNLWSLLVATQSGNSLVGTLQPCGFTVPDFALNPLVANEPYQLTLPNTLFDHVPAYIPATSATISSPSGFTLGGTFTMPPIAYQVGASLGNPISDAWPAVGALATVDTDADGKPGVTASYTSTGGYMFPRANTVGTARTDRAYTASRFSFSASGNTTSCSAFDGTVAFTNFDTHIVACRIAGGGDCTSAQRDTVDMGRPLFAPSSATMRALKVAAGTTCAAVRAALP